MTEESANETTSVREKPSPVSLSPSVNRRRFLGLSVIGTSAVTTGCLPRVAARGNVDDYLSEYELEYRGERFLLAETEEGTIRVADEADDLVDAEVAEDVLYFDSFLKHTFSVPETYTENWWQLTEDAEDLNLKYWANLLGGAIDAYQILVNTHITGTPSYGEYLNIARRASRLADYQLGTEFSRAIHTYSELVSQAYEYYDGARDVYEYAETIVDAYEQYQEGGVESLLDAAEDAAVEALDSAIEDLVMSAAMQPFDSATGALEIREMQSLAVTQWGKTNQYTLRVLGDLSERRMENEISRREMHLYFIHKLAFYGTTVQMSDMVYQLQAEGERDSTFFRIAEHFADEDQAELFRETRNSFYQNHSDALERHGKFIDYATQQIERCENVHDDPVTEPIDDDSLTVDAPDWIHPGEEAVVSVSAAGEPIEDATVEGEAVSASTDENGEATIMIDELGSHDLTAYRDGYESDETTILIREPWLVSDGFDDIDFGERGQLERVEEQQQMENTSESTIRIDTVETSHEGLDASLSTETAEPEEDVELVLEIDLEAFDPGDVAEYVYLEWAEPDIETDIAVSGTVLVEETGDRTADDEYVLEFDPEMRLEEIGDEISAAGYDLELVDVGTGSPVAPYELPDGAADAENIVVRITEDERLVADGDPSERIVTRYLDESGGTYGYPSQPAAFDDGDLAVYVPWSGENVIDVNMGIPAGEVIVADVERATTLDDEANVSLQFETGDAEQPIEFLGDITEQNGWEISDSDTENGERRLEIAPPESVSAGSHVLWFEVDDGPGRHVFRVEVDVEEAIPGTFVVDIDETTGPIEPGNELTGTAVVENVGDGDDTQEVGVIVDDNEVISREVTLDGGDSETIPFGYQTDEGDSGEIDVVIESEDDEAIASVRVSQLDRFEIEDVRSNDPVIEGEVLEVAVELTNTGDEALTRTVETELDGEPFADPTTVTVDGNESETHTIERATDEIEVADETEVEFSVDVEDDAETVRVTIIPDESVTIEITELDTNDPVSVHGQLEVTAVIANDGEADATPMVALELEDEEVETSEVQVDAGESTTIELSYETSEEDIGEREITVRAGESEEETTIEIEPHEPAEFAVESIETNAPIGVGEELEVTADIENVGEEDATRDVTLSIDGEAADSESTDLDGGEATTVNLAYETADDDDGELAVTVAAEDDDEETTTVTIEDVDPDVTVAPGTSLLRETDSPGGVAPRDVEWYVDDEGPQPEIFMQGYRDHTGNAAFSTTFESSGIYEVTATRPDGDVIEAWTVAVEDDGAAAPSIEEMTTDPSADETVHADYEIEVTVSAQDPAGRLERVLWQEGQNQVDIWEETPLSGPEDTATTEVTGPGGWLSAGYPTLSAVLTEDGRVSEVESDDGPAVRPPFGVDIVETTEPVAGEEPLEVTAEVENEAGLASPAYPDYPEDRQDIELALDGELVASETVELESDESTTITLSAELDSDGAGEREVTIRSPVDDDSTTVPVDTAAEPSISVVIVDTNTPVTAGEYLEVTAELENEGAQSTTQEVVLVVGHDPEQLDSETVSIDAGDAVTITLGYETPDVEADQEFPVQVETEDDTDEREVLVYGNEDDSADDLPDDPPDDDDDGSPGDQPEDPPGEPPEDTPGDPFGEDDLPPGDPPDEPPEDPPWDPPDEPPGEPPDDTPGDPFGDDDLPPGDPFEDDDQP